MYIGSNPLGRLVPRGFLLPKCVVGLVCCVLAGCSSLTGDIGLAVQAIIQSGEQPPLPSFGSGLNPAYRYLYVKPQDGIAAIFVLGYEKATPHGLQENWYSADGVFVSTLDGRLSATHGYPIGWAQSTWQWQGGQLVRTRDISAPHIYGVSDVIHASASSADQAPSSLTSWLQASSVQAPQLTWQADAYRTSPPSQSLPNAWLAYGWHRGLYSMVASHQCVEPTFCFQLARWPLDQISPNPP